MKKLIAFLFLIVSLQTFATITISPSTLPNGYAQHPYSQVLTASGGVSPYSWAVTGGTLPTGLVLQASSTGKISGTPTTIGIYSFTVTVTDHASTTARVHYVDTISYNYLTVGQMTSLWTRSVPPAPYGFDTWNSLLNVSDTSAYHAGTGISISGVSPSYTITNTKFPLVSTLSSTFTTSVAYTSASNASFALISATGLPGSTVYTIDASLLVAATYSVGFGIGIINGQSDQTYNFSNYQVTVTDTTTHLQILSRNVTSISNTSPRITVTSAITGTTAYLVSIKGVTSLNYPGSSNAAYLIVQLTAGTANAGGIPVSALQDSYLMLTKK